MIEYYGWVNILDDVCESDSTKLHKIVEEIRHIIEEIRFDYRILELKWMNGNCILCTAGSSNHRTKDVVDIIKLFETISTKAQGAYGLLYIFDDEDDGGTSDEFKVFRIAKGKVSIEKDHLLSPCNATIFED